jgi:hypothetical protein
MNAEGAGNASAEVAKSAKKSEERGAEREEERENQQRDVRTRNAQKEGGNKKGERHPPTKYYTNKALRSQR